MSFFEKQVTMPFSGRLITVKYALMHAVYWILITGFFIYEKKYLIYKATLPFFLVCVIGRIMLLIGIAYLNLHYFLPRYFLKRKYLHYFSLVLASMVMYLIAQGLLDYILYGYVIGPLRNSSVLETISYNFFSTLWYIGLIVALKFSIDWYAQQRILQRILVEKLKAEVNFLRSQVNPHFLFNILNNLYALTLKKSNLAPEVVLKLSEMMEYMLYDSDGGSVPLDKEIGYLNNYIELEKIRYDTSPDISLQISGDTDGKEIAPLLLLPLVENAFKHGLSRQPEKSWLHGKIKVSKSSIEFSVENSKSAAYQNNSRGGIGLDNLRKRLELLYPGRYLLTIEDKKEVFNAFMKINFQGTPVVAS